MNDYMMLKQMLGKLEHVAGKTDHLEAEMKNRKATEKELVKKNEEMELEMQRCRVELTSLKNEKEESKNEIKELKTQIEYLKNVCRRQGELLLLTGIELPKKDQETSTAEFERKLEQEKQREKEQQTQEQQDCDLSSVSVSIQKDATREDSKFDVCEPSSPNRLVTGVEFKVTGYGKVSQKSSSMDEDSGIYQTPAKGNYRFGGMMHQKGSGRLDLYLCEDKDRRRELLGTTDEKSDKFDKDVEWELEADVGVWLEVVKVEGNAQIKFCGMNGTMLG